MEDFKKGVELLGLGLALQSVVVAVYLFFMDRVTTTYEFALSFGFVLLVGLPTWYISSIAIMYAAETILPHWRHARIVAAWVQMVAMLLVLLITATTDIRFDEKANEGAERLNYGIHSVHYYNDQTTRPDQ